MTDVFRSAGKAAWPHILPPEILASLSPPERWREAISDPEQRVLVAEVDRLAGFTVIRASDDAGVAELDSFYVHPDFWSRGVGRALLDRCLAEMEQMGFEEATLWTAEENYRPRRIYERAGWSLDGGLRQRTLGGAELVELGYRTRIERL